MNATILISPMGKTYAVTIEVGREKRTYQANDIDEAQRRAERLCYILDLKPDIIKYLTPKATIRKAKFENRKAQ